MKKFLFLLLSTVLFLSAESQTIRPNPLPNFQQFGSSQTLTRINGILYPAVGYAPPIYTDTGTANLNSYLKNIPFAQISTSSDGKNWYRNYATTAWVEFGTGATTSLPISSLTAATGTNTINNVGYRQRWEWNSINNDTGFVLSSTSGNTHKILAVVNSGAFSSSNLSSTGIEVYVSKTGTNASNRGVYSRAIGGTYTTGLYGLGSSGTESNVGVNAVASGASTTSNIALNATASGASTINYGVSSIASGGTANAAIYGVVNGTGNNRAGNFVSSSTGTNSYGIDVSATGAATNNIAGYFSATGATNNYAIVVPSGGGRVGIGTTAPSASSLMELSSTTAGLLIPRMNTTQQNAISTPATGLLIYNTDSATIVQYNGSAWRKLGTGGESGWSLTGNAGTTAGTNFIGTTDAVDLVFKVNNIEKMRATATGIRIPQALAVGNNGGDTILYCTGGDTYIGGSYNNQNHGHFNENFFTYTNASGNENYLYIDPSNQEFSVGLNYNSQFGKRIFVNGLQRKITIGDVDNVNNGVILAVDDANENIIADKARVGIGTLSPTAWLDVQDADGAIATGIFNAHEDRSGEIVNIQQASTKKFSFNTSGAIEMQEQSSAPSTPASGYVSVYANSSNSQLYLKNDAATEKQLITSVNLLFGGGGNMDSDTTFFTTSSLYGNYKVKDDTLVVTSVDVVLQGTSPDVTVKIWYNDSLNVEAGATALVTAGNQVTNTTTGTTITSFDVTKIPPGNFVWVKTSTVATKPKYMSLQLNGYRK